MSAVAETAVLGGYVLAAGSLAAAWSLARQAMARSVPQDAPALPPSPGYPRAGQSGYSPRRGAESGPEPAKPSARASGNGTRVLHDPDATRVVNQFGQRMSRERAAELEALAAANGESGGAS